jgi:acyl-CoA synthetase (AMP-forming)/AMP-acid ligase II
MTRIATLADKRAVEAEMPVSERWRARSLYAQLVETAGRFPDRPATIFQLRSGTKDKVVTLTWDALRAEVTRTANLLRRLGVGDGDAVAFILPNGIEAAICLLAGATAGIVNPINPLLAPEHIAAILRETKAKVVVTLAPFPKSDLADKVAAALAEAPGVDIVLTVDLARYLAPPLRWIVPFVRPKRPALSVRVLDLARAMAAEPADALAFSEPLDDRICAYFHTGGTTGLPKVAQHRASGILYNGWCGYSYIFTERDVLMCPLPLFHVFAAYPILMSCLM